MRYAYASHTLNKKSRWALAYDNVCDRMSNLQVTFMNLCITYSLRTPNLWVTYYQYVGIRWKFCACTKFLGVHDVRQRMPACCSVPLTYAKLTPNVCNVHQRMDKISHTSAYVGAIRCGVSTPLHMRYRRKSYARIGTPYLESCISSKFVKIHISLGRYGLISHPHITPQTSYHISRDPHIRSALFYSIVRCKLFSIYKSNFCIWIFCING